jgi:hypothetical protein
MLTNMGTIKFDKYGITSDSGSGTGYDGLTGSYAQLYIKQDQECMPIMIIRLKVTLPDQL